MDYMTIPFGLSIACVARKPACPGKGNLMSSNRPNKPQAKPGAAGRARPLADRPPATRRKPIASELSPSRAQSGARPPAQGPHPQHALPVMLVAGAVVVVALFGLIAALMSKTALAPSGRPCHRRARQPAGGAAPPPRTQATRAATGATGAVSGARRSAPASPSSKRPRAHSKIKKEERRTETTHIATTGRPGHR